MYKLIAVIPSKANLRYTFFFYAILITYCSNDWRIYFQLKWFENIQFKAISKSRQTHLLTCYSLRKTKFKPNDDTGWWSHNVFFFFRGVSSKNRIWINFLLFNRDKTLIWICIINTNKIHKLTHSCQRLENDYIFQSNDNNNFWRTNINNSSYSFDYNSCVQSLFQFMVYNFTLCEYAANNMIPHEI